MTVLPELRFGGGLLWVPVVWLTLELLRHLWSLRKNKALAVCFRHLQIRRNRLMGYGIAGVPLVVCSYF